MLYNLTHMTRSNRNRAKRNAKANTPNTSRLSTAPVSTSGTPTKSGRAKMKPSNVPQTMGIVALPRGFRSWGDETSLKLRSTSSIANSSAGHAQLILALSPVHIGATNYVGLGDTFPLVLGMAPSYARFMITRVVAQLVPTTGTTLGGYVALGFQADDTNTEGPPSSLLDVTTAVHSDVAQVSETACIQFNVSDYYNEWKYSSPSGGSSTNIGQAGVIQLVCVNSGATGDIVALLQLEIDIHFSGYRSLV